MELADFVLRCCLAIAVGLLFSLDLPRKEWYWGIKAFLLLALGTALFAFFASRITHGPALFLPTLAIAASLFGGAAILHTKALSEGFSRASLIWIVMAVSLFLGGGWIFLGVVAAILVGMVMLFFKASLEKQEVLLSQYAMDIEVQKIGTLEKLEKMIASLRLRVQEKSVLKHDTIHVRLSYLATPVTHLVFSRRLFRLKGVANILQI